MKRSHFDAFRPVCPVCRRTQGRQSRLSVHSVFREDRGDILEGLLLCEHPDCRSEFPIIDGAPVIVPDVRNFISQNILSIMDRDDLSEEMESLIGDCSGPGSAFDVNRQHLSMYTFDHFGDLDPEPDLNPDAVPGSAARLLERGLELLPDPPQGPVIDLGCALGRGTLHLAGLNLEPVLGVDLNFNLLRAAGRTLRRGRVAYPRRRVGLVYDRREFPVELPGGSNVDYWALDAQDPPFDPGLFSLVTALNLIDCVPSPIALLQAVALLLRPGGQAVIATPYDWSASVTPVEAWLGGHSQRSPEKGAGETALRRLLDPAGGRAVPGLRLESEILDLPWSVRLHGRGVMRYRVHLAAVRAAAATPESEAAR